MTFADIPAGVTIFLDANVLVYHFSADPVFGRACGQLIARIAKKEIQAAISAAALSNVAHRMMTTEAIQQFGWQVKNIANRLRKQPAEIAKLKQHQQAVREVAVFGISTLPVHYSHVAEATKLSNLHGLLSGDALIVAVMQDANLTHLASNDDDFDRVPGLIRYSPI